MEITDSSTGKVGDPARDEMSKMLLQTEQQDIPTHIMMEKETVLVEHCRIS